MNELKLFGGTTRKTFIFIALAECLSFSLYWLKDAIDLRLYFFILLLFFLFALGVWRLKWLVFIAIVEMIIGSKGHLFSAEIFGFTASIRIAIFTAVMICWLFKIGPSKSFLFVINILKQSKPLIYLGLAIVFGFIFALFRATPFQNIFFDLNGWLFFIYLFPWLHTLTEKGDIAKLVQIFFACLIALISKTLIFLYVFCHQMPLMRDLYIWGRGTVWGEFTALNNGLYRIFSQSQIYIVIGFFIFLAALYYSTTLNSRMKCSIWLMLFLISSVIIISLSRSFWVGLLCGLAGFIVLIGFFFKQNIKKLAYSLLSAGAIFAIGFALTLAIINFPFPKPIAEIGAETLLNERLKEDSAVSSRWSQLPALKNAIFKHPVVGSGWGSVVTYFSNDPRIKTLTNPTGKYMTYSFEWGYLDIILKIGLAGMVIYLLLIFSIFKNIFIEIKKNSSRDFRALLVGLISGLITVLAVHFFSPYLNHPLGIGYLLLLLVFINNFPRLNEEQRL